jgi:hypothetical protein
MAGRSSLNACESKVGKAYALLAHAESCAEEAAPAPSYVRSKDYANDYEDSMFRAQRQIANARASLDEAFKWLRGASNVLDNYKR